MNYQNGTDMNLNISKIIHPYNGSYLICRNSLNRIRKSCLRKLRKCAKSFRIIIFTFIV